MFRRHRTRRTRWVVAAVAATTLTLLGAGVVAAIPAQADLVTTRNGFEGNPYDFWNARYTEGSSIVTLIDHVDARNATPGLCAGPSAPAEGCYIAWFDAPGTVPARISSNALLLPEPSGGQATCTAEMYVKKAIMGVPTFTPPPTGNPRIQLTVSERRGIADTVIDGSTYTLTNTDYRRAEFASWPYRSGNIIVEVSVTGGAAHADDLLISCLSTPR